MTLSAEASTLRSFRPPAPPERAKPLSRLGMAYALWRNPLEVWTRAHFELPILVGRTALGLRAVGQRSTGDPPRAARQCRELPQGRAAIARAPPGSRRRAADRRGGGVEHPAARDRAVVLATSGQGFRARDAPGRTRRGRADRLKPNDEPVAVHDRNGAHDAGGAGANAVQPGACARSLANFSGR